MLLFHDGFTPGIRTEQVQRRVVTSNLIPDLGSVVHRLPAPPHNYRYTKHSVTSHAHTVLPSAMLRRSLASLPQEQPQRTPDHAASPLLSSACTQPQRKARNDPHGSNERFTTTTDYYASRKLSIYLPSPLLWAPSH